MAEPPFYCNLNSVKLKIQVSKMVSYSHPIPPGTPPLKAIIPEVSST